MQKRKKNNTGHNIGCSAFWFFITAGALFLLYIFSSFIPKYKIRENLLESAKYLVTSENLFHQINLFVIIKQVNVSLRILVI